MTGARKTDEQRKATIRQNINQAVVSGSMVDIFEAVGLEKSNIGLLDDEFLVQVRNLPERSLAVELLKRLPEGEITSRFASNFMQRSNFCELLGDAITRYQNRSIETALVMEELIDMAKKFRKVAKLGGELGPTGDEIHLYDAQANKESVVCELTDETLHKIVHELTDNLRKNITADWSKRESVRASLRL